MIGTNLAITTKNYAVAGGVTYDADALAYFTANTAITSDADKNAINTFYLGLKSDGIYTKMKAMYLPLWSSATANKWNLKDPRDLDAAFRLTFATGWTYSSGGMTPANAFANTFLNSFSNINNAGHLSYYSRTQTISTTQNDIGNINNSIVPAVSCFIASTSTIDVGYHGSTSLNTQQNISDKRGFVISSKLSSTSLKLYKNGTLQNTVTTSNTINTPNLNIYLGARNNNNTADTFSTKQLSFASIGDGLTDTEAANFYNRVQTLMTYFVINV